ncbi:hypothetical protein [Parapedobacter sp. 10938]|uniref:hypothetical protein n=1 Tax=Parapedobacter flavus TaxID=3110225 RepID=UPI002DBFB8C9|nr:hypothetical protein [Parapedobacter sp. 10938]MEC3881017.1 hypothetical protein [Parapedobacter sp. 10938]
MKTNLIIPLLFFLLDGLSIQAQPVLSETQATISKMDKLLLKNKLPEALHLLENAIAATDLPADLAYLYANQSGLYASMDSLLVGKRLLDLSLENAEKSGRSASKAAAYRAKAYLNNRLNSPDEAVKDALEGLALLEGNEDELTTKYHFNYLLYSVYSKWDDGQRMEKYIRTCHEYAVQAADPNLQANAINGISSMYVARYRKTQTAGMLDSVYTYLNRAFALDDEYPGKVNGNTFVITCINLANYYLEFSAETTSERMQKAFRYLDLAEDKLRRGTASAEKWVNVFGIRSGFAKAMGNIALAEQYLLEGLTRLTGAGVDNFDLEYMVNKELADIARTKDDLQSAISYQESAEGLLKKMFDHQQALNAQKLEIQYETEKKDRELTLLKERAELRKRQNYLYGGIAIASIFALVFMFSSYRFRLRYSRERERKLQREKEEAEQRSAIRIQLEKEEHARLKAEQELLDLKRQQLEKEALANTLIIEHKNDTLKQIQHKIREGDAGNVQKLLKEEMLMRADFDDIKLQMQQLHPDFFNRLHKKATQKLTPLDLRYCAYIYLQMNTKQIAQVLHIEPQSVRMSKYRLKQKFGLDKSVDLEFFLSHL